MTTIRDVARLAGVSTATVSRVLNNNDYVSKDARKKVDLAVKKLDYSPNEVARSLYKKSSKFIGLLLPDISNPFFPAIAKGAEDYINKKGYSLLLGNVGDNQKKKEEYIKVFEQNNVAGIITAVQAKYKKSIKIPIVVLDRVDSDAKYSIFTDDYFGGRLAAKSISDRNSKKIVVMAGPEDSIVAVDRLAGNKKELDNNEISYEVFQTKSYLIDYAEETAQTLFDKYPMVDSVIASNDIYAIALMKEAIKRELKIPEDFQIIGYDDILFSRMIYPGLSTISQPAYEIGYQGAKLLCDILEKRKVEEAHIQLAIQPIIRESLRKRDENK